MTDTPAPADAAVLVWCEIPVTDMARAMDFYSDVFKYELTLDETGPNPMANFPMASGAAGHLYPGTPAGDGRGNTVHLAVPDKLEDAIARVDPAGGKTMGPIITIPPGRFAYATDPDGNSLGLFEPT